MWKKKDDYLNPMISRIGYLRVVTSLRVFVRLAQLTFRQIVNRDLARGESFLVAFLTFLRTILPLRRSDQGSNMTSGLTFKRETASNAGFISL